MDIQRVKDLYNFFDDKDDGYCERYGEKMFEVDVKRHRDYVSDDEMDKILNKYPKRFKERIRISDSDMESIYYNFLEMIYEDFKNTMDYSTDYLDDKKLIEIIKNVSDYGIYGRSGGHFCFTYNYCLEDIEGVLDYLESGDELETHIVDSYRDIDDSLSDNEKRIKRDDNVREIIKDYEKIREDILSFKEFVDNFNENYEWRKELEFRIEERYNEELSDERELRRLKRDEDKTSTSLKELLKSKNETIKRHAIGILRILK